MNRQEGRELIESLTLEIQALAPELERSDIDQMVQTRFDNKTRFCNRNFLYMDLKNWLLADLPISEWVDCEYSAKTVSDVLATYYAPSHSYNSPKVWETLEEDMF